MIVNIVKKQDTVTNQIHNIINAIGLQGRRRILLEAGKEFLKQTRANFGTTGKYRDKQWPSLSTKYAKKVGSPVPTLMRSRALYESIKMNAPRKNYVEIYTTNKYAAAQAFGNPRKNLPARNFWPMQFSSKTYSRPVFAAEKDLILVISKQLTILSRGSLPLQSLTIVRSPYQYGNPFTAPQGI